MKQIGLIQHQRPNRKSIYLDERNYRIFLYQGKTIRFSSKKNMERFISELNRFLTKSLHELIGLYSEVSKSYWATWFYMDSHDRSINHRIKNNQDRGLSLLESLPKMVNLAVDRCHYTNGNPFTFGYFTKSIDALDGVINILIDIRKIKHHYAEIYRLETLLTRTLLLRNEIDSIDEKIVLEISETV